MRKAKEKVRKGKPGKEAGSTLQSVALLSGSEGNTEVDLESSPEDFIYYKKVRHSQPPTQGKTSCAAWPNSHTEGDTVSNRKKDSSKIQGKPISRDKQGGVAVS